MADKNSQSIRLLYYFQQLKYNCFNGIEQQNFLFYENEIEYYRYLYRAKSSCPNKWQTGSDTISKKNFVTASIILKKHIYADNKGFDINELNIP